MKKAGKTIITIVYGIGTVTVLALLVSVVFRLHTVLFPDAMLPMELHELASVWLAMGFVPMSVVSILFYRVWDISKSSRRKRNTVLTYIPATICLGCILFWAGVLGIGILHMRTG